MLPESSYRIMHESNDHGADSHIVFSTVGYLVNWLAHNEDALKNATHVILDEAHERSVDMDLLALLLKRKMRVCDFKLIIMSATLETSLYAEYFKEFNDDANIAPLHVGVKRYPVERMFLDDFLKAFSGMLENHKNYCITQAQSSDRESQPPVQLGNYIWSRIKQFNAAAASKKTQNHAKKVQNMTPTIPEEDYDLSVLIALDIARIGDFPDGEDKEGECILVFLPGESEIMTWIEVLDKHLVRFSEKQRSRVQVHILHSQTPREQLDLAFVPAEANCLKLVLSTNIAESSVTISDVTNVIDHGLRRALEYNSQMGCQMLKLGFVSCASSMQRAGRAGRCRPGRYIAMLTKEFFNFALKDHDSPEILTLSLDQTILKVKSLFPSESVKDILESLIEPPSTSQIVQSFAKLFNSGALTKPSSWSAISKHIPDESLASITFLGSVSPRFPCDLSISRLLLIGAACDVATEACVIAAALSCTDPFTMPTSYFTHNRAELYAQVAASFGCRAEADAGAYSEPLSILNLFKDWLRDGSNCEDGKLSSRWLQTRGLNNYRWKQVCASTAMFAGRLGDVLNTIRLESVTRDVKAKLARTLSKLGRLKNVAGGGIQHHRRSEGMGGKLEAIFQGSPDAVRAIILAGCSDEIYHGVPHTTMDPDMASKSLAKLGRKPVDSKANEKSVKKLLEAQLTAQLFDNGSQPKAAACTMDGAIFTKAAALAPFFKYVPTAPAPGAILAADAAIDPKEYSYNVVYFPNVPAQHPPFDVRRTANLVISAKKAPPEARDASEIRKMFAWMGCIRVLTTKSFAFLEFMDDGEQPRTLEMVLSDLERMKVSQSSSDSPSKTFDKIFNDAPLSSTETNVVQLGDTQREVQSSSIQTVSKDLCFSLKFLCSLAMGRTYTWMPYTDAATATIKEEGLELGKINTGFKISYKKRGVKIPAHLNWRAPWAGSAPVVVTVSKTLVNKESRKKNAWKQRETFTRETKSFSVGNEVFAAAGSSQLVENAHSAFLGLNGVTLFPSNDPLWSLRMLVLSTSTCSLQLINEEMASDLRHFHQVRGAIESDDYENEVSRASGFNGGVLKKEDLPLLNEARSDFGKLFYSGEGLLEQKLFTSFVKNMKTLAEKVSGRAHLLEISPETQWSEFTTGETAIQNDHDGEKFRTRSIPALPGPLTGKKNYFEPLQWPSYIPFIDSDDVNSTRDFEYSSNAGSDSSTEFLF
ncbi:hypothetical protein HDU82_000122, partial [Entophlyctis luteolus]